MAIVRIVNMIMVNMYLKLIDIKWNCYSILYKVYFLKQKQLREYYAKRESSSKSR